MTVLRRIFLSACVLALFLGAAPAALGDWYPGEPNKMHYPQLPDPFGWDICVNCQWVADDFECSEDGPIEDIHFWISWLDDLEGWDIIQNWDISIWSDAIGGPGACGMQPGTRLWTWQGDGNVQTNWWPADGDQGWHCPSVPWSEPQNHVNIYQINITNIQEVFTQEAGTIYWLVIKVNLMTEPPPVPGWKTSYDAWRCRALWSPTGGPPWSLVDTGSPMGTDPVYHDMAFVITGEEQTEEYLEHCDAPEGSWAVAYPSTGVTGSFPTCVTTGPGGFIQHNNFGASLGPGWEFEWEGDAGLCPGCFPTYDDDECFADGDAGLLIPESYTIDALLNVIPCPLSPSGGTPLGFTCQTAQWGTDIDLEVHNHMPGGTIGYVNVLCDWDQNGAWSGASTCVNPGDAPEHVLVNFPVPNPFDGPLSVLLPPSFMIGPKSGYVWMRCSITEQQVPLPWDGSGSFEDGESEAYLIRVDTSNLDWSDAPDNWPVGGGYPTLSGPWLGDNTDSPDGEPDGQPDPAALGDDMDTLYPPANDDEDGVSFPVLVEGQTDTITFQVSGGVGGGVVQIWIDWNGNMSWLDAGEMVYHNLDPDGVHSFSVTPPAGSSGQTFLRARISSGGGLPPDGPASDGEVEDHLVVIEDAPLELDYGDAPDPCYPTWLINGGARHVIGGPFFCDALGGDAPDADADGQPTALADGDDLDADGDDEDGVTIPNFNQGQSSNILFNVCNAPGGANVQIWIDWDGSGSWENPAERVYSNLHFNGNYSVPITAPATSVVGLTFARCRISTAGGLRPDGLANDGEVEDHTVTIEQATEEFDFGDAPEPPYPTTLAVGARHTIAVAMYLGNGVDAEPDGQPDAAAMGDDLNLLYPGIPYPPGDEDGVVFTSPLMPGSWASVDVWVSAAGYLNAWVDFAGNGSWAEAVDQIFTDVALDPTVNPNPQSLTFFVPFGAQPGPTFARFRYGTQLGLSYDGAATDGEVEDYEVDIEENPSIKWIQLPETSPNGIDIKVTGQWLADDFECTSYGPITDVHLWCSWKYEEWGEVTSVHLSFHTDDPVGPGGSDPCNLYSKPDELKWERDFVPGEFSLQEVAVLPDGEWWWDPCDGTLIPGGDYRLWRMDINIPVEEAFFQDGDPCNPVIYWMDVRVEVESQFTELGWKTRRYPEQFADDAVFHGGGLPFDWKELRYPDLHPHHPNSIDMAFVLTGEEWERPKEPVPHLKWSQPPIEWDPTLIIPLYCGWDQESWTTDPCTWWLAVADDFRCLGTMPITSVHWWASHLGWDEDVPPDPGPSAWRIGFWSNIPANATADPCFSRPEKLLWQVEVAANRVQVDYVGKDLFPDMPLETCFQYYVELDGPEWFWQSHYELETRDNVFWISIVAIYASGTDPVYEWGWKTRPWPWMDDAVTFEHWGPFDLGIVLDPALIMPIENPLTQKSMDVAFELDTDPCYIKWEQPFTGIRHWPHYEDERSMGTWEPVTVYKWWQGPDLTMGLDVDMTDDLAGTQPAQILADDFECTSSEPITDVHVWCSWLHDEVFDPENVMFTLSIHDDIPAGPVPYSMPGDVRWWRDFYPGEFMAWPYATDLLEGWWSPCTGYYDPDGDTICWEYDFYIDPGEAFVQEGSPDNRMVYWLDVQAQPYDEMERIGWKTSNEPWNDDGVWAVGNEPYVGAWQELLHPMSAESLDLAFAITAEQEEFFLHSLVADDWPCDNNKPVTAVVWWGSYIGYTYEACQAQLAAPPVRPDYFWLAIWDDVPAVVGEPTSYSHPNSVVWEYATRDYDEVLVGYDKHPHGAPNEPVFRYSVRVPKEHWFFQKEPNSVYWLSVVAVWDVNWPNYDWGWTNHEYVYNDDAVTGYVDESGAWVWAELFDQTGVSEDMSFILFTEPDCLSVLAPEYADWILWGRPDCWCYPRQCRGDIDGIQTGPFHVAIPDLGIFKQCFNQFVMPPGCICADLDHMQTGPFRVAIPDLTIFKTYFNQFFVPQCDQLPIYTGPYNFWTSP
ncbi:MAG: DUF7901 domain-containing protein [Planctomycetota bacterium]|jgi:hypothetical protein